MSAKPRTTSTSGAASRPWTARAAVAKAGASKYVLRLYVTGTTPRSVAAIRNIKEICEEHLKGRYQLEVIDVYQRPTLARGEQIVATPTLIRELPAPLRRLIGDLSDVDRVLMGLDLKTSRR